MRGVSLENIAPLQRELSALGLLDSDARAEAVRNIVPSPLAGFDPTAVVDARPLVVALEALLSADKALHDLPAKFGFSIDGGGALPLAGVATDVDFTAIAGDEAPRLRVTLGGVVAGWVAPQNLGAAAAILARHFLALRENDRRMSALVARIGVAPLLEGSSAVIERSAADEAICAGACAKGGEAAPYGKILGARKCGAENFVGAGLLFGRIDADALEALAVAAKESGAAELRLTPWRAVLAVGLSSQGAKALAARLEKRGFIIDSGDPRLAFAACPGAPACPSALGDVRALALALAPHWRAHAGRVHVSGCAKGCALNARAVTLVAGDGGFSLVEDGFARDRPIARRLDLAACQQQLNRISTGARV
jgi:precorrin-3B synthase